MLGAGDLVMLAIGAVIGAGIFGAIGTAAAGQVGPDGDGDPLRRRARRSSFRSCCSAAACALAALCYAELAAMIPQAGSAYAYTYATLGELVAWIIGWDLILEYAVGNVAVAISWGDYFNTLLRGVGIAAAGVADDRAIAPRFSAPIPAVHGLLETAPQRRRHADAREPAGVRHRDADHMAAAARRARERHAPTTSWWSSSSLALGAVHRGRR